MFDTKSSNWLFEEKCLVLGQIHVYLWWIMSFSYTFYLVKKWMKLKRIS